jgi:N-glycosylase/DNA lyase
MNAAACVEAPPASRTHVFPVRDYDLAVTLHSGQAFRWQPHSPARPKQADNFLLHMQPKVVQPSPLVRWVGIVGTREVWLRQTAAGLEAEVAVPVADWRWLGDYLQTGVNLASVLATFPPDEPMCAAVQACRGLRLLRQDPWECLASFILSSTKQITQIRQIVATLCVRFGEPVAPILPGEDRFAFPTAARLAQCSEAELRACKAGFRAPYLLGTARRVTSGECDLARLAGLSLVEARAQLLQLPGVGPKIADCALLFAFGFPEAFPLDVWVLRALGQLYFPRRRVTLRRLREFAATHFGPHAGYAQQYLFHYMRTHRGPRPQP